VEIRSLSLREPGKAGDPVPEVPAAIDPPPAVDAAMAPADQAGPRLSRAPEIHARGDFAPGGRMRTARPARRPLSSAPPPRSRLTFHRRPIGRGTPGAGLLARMGHEHVAVAGDGGGTAPSFGPTGCSP